MRTKLTCGTFIVLMALGTVLDAAPAMAQGVPGMVPPVPGAEPARIEPVPPRIPPDFQEPRGEKKPRPKKTFDAEKAHQEAFELAFLASQIPDDMQKVKMNVLPKDLIPKLKRIEKLCKKLRSEVTQ
jgi:hypothetical protein